MASNPLDNQQQDSQLARFILAGDVSQEPLDQHVGPAPCLEPTPCRVHDPELEGIADLQAEIQQITLELQTLLVAKDRGNILSSYHLTHKCQVLTMNNSHLEEVLKRTIYLRQGIRLVCATHKNSVDEDFHKYADKFLVLAAAFTEKLESYLSLIPQNCPSNMKSALAKIKSLMTKGEELSGKIQKLREDVELPEE
ncbi:HAUS augmin-like complex subunit 2 [Podarcis raffonei]|uniref:HAUS augmin-like complex subunit 2 n=1 Tax=Podarcis raffonei TaxID=65483 RepID=UPI0023291DC5|nr:HAUS augmin-like complex subunit 2 [Podarcis raffonei]